MALGLARNAVSFSWFGQNKDHGDVLSLGDLSAMKSATGPRASRVLVWHSVESSVGGSGNVNTVAIVIANRATSAATPCSSHRDDAVTCTTQIWNGTDYSKRSKTQKREMGDTLPTTTPPDKTTTRQQRQHRRSSRQEGGEWRWRYAKATGADGALAKGEGTDSAATMACARPPSAPPSSSAAPSAGLCQARGDLRRDQRVVESTGCRLSVGVLLLFEAPIALLPLLTMEDLVCRSKGKRLSSFWRLSEMSLLSELLMASALCSVLRHAGPV